MSWRQWVSPDNTARAWARRATLGLRSRPDVRLEQLSRKIDVLERLADLPARSAVFTARLEAALSPAQSPDVPLRRFGSRYDGGYVLPPRLLSRATGVVSIGVGYHNAVDVELADMGLTVHAWDHTVDALPTPHERITFHKNGLGDTETDSRLLKLDRIVAESFGPDAGGLILMLDAEGAEWSALRDAGVEMLDKFDVVAIEYHGLGDLFIDPEPILDVLDGMRSVFLPVVVHPNNHAATWELPGATVADALEVTYVNRRLLSGPVTSGNCPQDLLSPCCPDLPEVAIDFRT